MIIVIIIVFVVISASRIYFYAFVGLINDLCYAHTLLEMCT